MRGSVKEKVIYDTWYDFKQELQRRSGLVLLNKVWLQNKPKDPLPWNEYHMKTSLKGLSKWIQHLTVCPRCGGNLVLDRDEDGYYKRCIQCSCNISLNILETEKPAPQRKPVPEPTIAPKYSINTRIYLQ